MTCATERRASRRLSSVAVRVAVAALVIATLTSCFPSSPSPRLMPSGLARPQSVAPLAHVTSPRVLAYCPVEDAIHFSGYPLVVDEVYICRGDGVHPTDGVTTFGPWESASRVDHPSSLLRAYGKPNARAVPAVCGHFPSDPLVIWVHHDGVTTAYYAPVDACGSPSEAAATAYENAKRTLLVEVDRGANPVQDPFAAPAPAAPSQKDENG